MLGRLIGRVGGADCRDDAVTFGGHCRLIRQGTEAGASTSALPSLGCVCHPWLSTLEADAGHRGRHG